MPSIRIKQVYGSGRAEFLFLDGDALRRGKLRAYDHDDDVCARCGTEIIRFGKLTSKCASIVCECGSEYDINANHDPPPIPAE